MSRACAENVQELMACAIAEIFVEDAADEEVTNVEDAAADNESIAVEVKENNNNGSISNNNSSTSSNNSNISNNNSLGDNNSSIGSNSNNNKNNNNNSDRNSNNSVSFKSELVVCLWMLWFYEELKRTTDLSLC
eukprot:Awhi_evm2s6287